MMENKEEDKWAVEDLVEKYLFDILDELEKKSEILSKLDDSQFSSIKESIETMRGLIDVGGENLVAYDILISCFDSREFELSSSNVLKMIYIALVMKNRAYYDGLHNIQFKYMDRIFPKQTK